MMVEDNHTKKRKLELDTIRDPPNKINGKQWLTLEKWCLFIRTSEDTLETLKAEISELGECIATDHEENLDWLRSHHDFEATTLHTLNRTGECNDFPMYIERMRSYRKEFNERIRAVKRYVKDAKTKQKIMQKIMRKRHGRQY